MCRHLLSLLGGGSFPVARYLAAARNNKRQVRRCFPLSLAFEMSDRPVLSLPAGRCQQTHWSRFGDRESLSVLGNLQWDNPQAERWAIADSTRKLHREGTAALFDQK
jgi:hypothetical protein